MGCGNSKQQTPPVVAPMEPTAHQDGSTPQVDGTMFVTKGGSYVIGRKYAGAWEPGSPIPQPDVTTETTHYYMPINPTTALRVSYASSTEQGRAPKPPQKPNQDSFLHITCLGNNPAAVLLAVFDGHGPRGEDASHYCRVNLPDLIVRNPVFTKNPFDAFTSAFEATHRAFISPDTHKAGVDTMVSGTTAIAVLLYGTQYACANVGDSRAILCSVSGKGSVIPRPLSNDHKPNRADEKARIQTSSARVLSETQLGIEGGDPNKFYVCRVHNGSIRYGVLFTRSIGDADAHTHLGLSATPEVKTGKITQHDRSIVIATDGVWDVLSVEEVTKLVVESGDNAQTAAARIVEVSKSRWDVDIKGRRDDITAVVAFLKYMDASEADAEQKRKRDDGRAVPTDIAVEVVPTSRSTPLPSSAASSPQNITVGGEDVQHPPVEAIPVLRLFSEGVTAATSSNSLGQVDAAHTTIPTVESNANVDPSA